MCVAHASGACAFGRAVIHYAYLEVAMGKTPQWKLDANRRWRERHREQAREIDRRYREAHREEKLETDRRYREAHQTEITAVIREKRKSGEYKPNKGGRKPIYTFRSR